MSKIPKSKRELAPEGVHKAVCVHVIDLGTQEFQIKGKTQSSRKVSVGFELLGKKRTDGNVHVIATRYTFSNSPKSNLMKDLKAWLGIKTNDFEMDNLLGKGALITVTHTDDGDYANVTNVSGLPDKGKLPKPETPLTSFYLDDFDKDTFDGLEDYFKEKIAMSPEYDDVAAPKSKTKKGK